MTVEKDMTTAGLLAIFLGGFGADYLYLGEKTKGITLLIVGILLMFFNFCSWILCLIPYVGWILYLFVWGIPFLAFLGLSIWGIVRGIKYLRNK